jgi:fructose-bisphosphate aldolase class I
MDGDFSIDVSAAVTQKVLAYQYYSLAQHHVILEGTLLKPNMVRPGEGSKAPFDPAAIARATVRVLQHTLPVSVPGVTFLSGGMGEEDATISLNEINKFEGKKPWALTFSYGRALQQSVLHVWKGKAENVAAAQKELIGRAKANLDAVHAKYAGGAAGGAAADASLHVKNYTY